MLRLQWSDSSDGDKSNQQHVLDGLQPHQNIRSLIIENFMGDHFPSWTMKMTINSDQARLDNLTNIELINCNRCTEIPTLGTLPLLEILKLSKMGSLKSIGPSFYHNDLHDSSSSSNNQTSSPAVFFPVLKALTLDDMPSLLSWVEPKEIMDGNAIAFPVLEILEVRKCPLLSEAPIHDLPLLEILSLRNCMIKNFPKGIGSCARLRSLSFGPIFREEDFIQDGVLPNSLQVLELYGSEELELSGFRTEALPEWLGNISSLQELRISDWKYLKHLPSREAMLRLTKLRLLQINSCPLLEERFKPEVIDSEWPKISHITEVEVNGSRMNYRC